METTYESAGVNIDAGNQAVDKIKDQVKSTYDTHVLTGLGSFGTLYDISFVKHYDQPVLVQSIDGVGTKLKVAKMMNKYEFIGEDIVNHCCNDVLCQGARPVTFLDYIASDKLEPDQVAEIIKGMIKACKENSVSLIGGEMAEMPGVYLNQEIDVVGTITGVVEKTRVITGDEIQDGDVLLGLASTGLHTNGYSLVRKVFFEQNSYSVDSKFEELEESLGEALIRPHKTYANSIMPLLNYPDAIHGIVHITGGGFWENIPRVLPKDMSVQIYKDSWDVLPIFKLISEMGSVSEKEMYRVFNMGIGMILFCSKQEVEKIKQNLVLSNETVYEIGEVVQSERVRIISK